MANDFQRFVILNRLVSKSVSRAPDAFKPPLVGGEEMLRALEERKFAGHAIEFIGADDTGKSADETDGERIARCNGHDFLWLREIVFKDRGAHRYATLLLEFVDESKSSFSVVDTSSLAGRDITGEQNERGGASCHIVVRLPIKQHDDGTYRCAIEAAHHINRSMIETFISRQLRRWAHSNELSYEVHIPNKKGSAQHKVYKYTPKLALYADVGRSLSFANSGDRELAHMTFSKRSTKQSIGGKDHVQEQELLADVELRVSAKQGPTDPKERYTWLSRVRSFYEKEGFQTKLTYRHLTNGGLMSGNVHKDLAGAADLVMCQKELMSLNQLPRDWYAGIDGQIEEQMATFLDKDQLWERGK